MEAARLDAERLRAQLDGNKLTVRMGKETLKSTFTVDPTKKPKQIRVAPAGKTQTWSYVLDGDTLKMAVTPKGEPAAGLDGKEVILATLKRIK